MRKLYATLIGVCLLLFSFSSFSQTPVTLTGTSYSQNFDGLGATNLPPDGWSVRKTATATSMGTVDTVTQAASPWSNTSGKFYNYASGELGTGSSTAAQAASTDRVLGVRQSGSYADPGAAFVFKMANTTGFANFVLSFNAQSLDAAAARITTWRIEYALGDTSSFIYSGTSFTTGNSSFSNTPVTVNFGNALNDNNQVVTIRIVALASATGSGSRAATAIDDVSLTYTTTGTVTTTASVAAGSNAAEPSTNGSFTVTLSSASASPITITYDFTGSTATLGSDFSDPGTGSVTIPAGQLSATIPINMIDDALPEATETITINLTGATSPYTIVTGTASISLTSEDIATIDFTGNYSQDFNTLAISGTASTTPDGWFLSETGTNANTTYAAGNGSSNAGNTYSFGTGTDPDRAFGGIRSGSLNPTIGALLTNNTGITITSLMITFTGEQWRLGTTGRNDRLDFQYSPATSSLTAGTWTDVDGLDFIAPNSTGTVGAFDGNTSANRKTITYIINGLSIPAGTVFGIRWEDYDVTGAEDGLGIDDVTITLGCTPPTNQPTGLNLTPALQSIAGNFTAAAAGSTPADDYLVLISTSPTLTELPASGTAYAIDDVIGNASVVSINGTTFTATELVPSTAYYFFVFSYSSATNCYNTASSALTGSSTTNAPPVCTPPITQASNLTGNSITGTSIDLGWARGTGDNVLAIARSGVAVDAIIYNSVGYAAGTEIGTGNFVIYNGPANSFAYTGLNQNTTYHFALYEYSTADSCYLTPALTGNFTTLCTDPVNVSAFAATTDNGQLPLSWTLPSTACFDEIILVASSSSVTGVGSDFTGTAAPAYTSGEQIVYRGTGTSVTVTGLTNGTTYYFKAFTRKGINYSNGVQITATPFDPASGFMYLFGNLHAHSAYSDGNKDDLTKTPEDDFKFARDALCMDFLGISEHNHSGAGMSLPNFSLGYAQANSLNGVASTAGNTIVTLWGMEWGVISGGGHVLVYGFDDDLLGWETGNYDVYVGKNDYSALWNTVNGRSGAIATLAHPNSTDFGNIASAYNATADAAISGVAIESGPAFSTSTTYNDFPSSLAYLSYYRNMLSKGYRLAPQMDQDNHNMTFGTANANRMVLLTAGKTREAVMEAIRAMRYYASEDCNARIDFRNGTNPMGSQVSNAGVPSLTMSVTDPDAEAVTSIELWGGEAGGSLPSAALKTYTTSSFSFTASDASNIQPDNSTWYYYAVITQEDGNKIVTAPIWYTRNDATLPVILTQFRGQYNKEQQVIKLSWTTSQESNSKQFNVEKSTNGIDFKIIGTVAAAGNSNIALQYAFDDNGPVNGNNYYRLNQVDLDGSKHLSSVIRIVVNNGYIITYGPNPAHQNLTVTIQNNKTPLTVQLTSLNGQLLQQRTLAAAGTQTVVLPVAHLAKGMYLLKFLGNDGIRTEKIIVD